MKYKLIEHNSKGQRGWGANDDTRKYLELGKVYDGKEEKHTWHTKIIIDGKKFNSVCFKAIKGE